MRAALLWLLALVGVVLTPIVLRRQHEPAWPAAAEALIIVSPHTEAIRHEFSVAFESYYARKTGRRVRLDWRTPGGTSEISRFLESRYLAAFQHYWVETLHRPWSGAVARGFADPKVRLPEDPAADSVEQQARRAFLSSSIGSGLDLFFGGGAYDFIQHAAAGRLVDCGLLKTHPEIFGPGGIPQSFGGETYWDPEGRWVGACLDAFGICSNVDSLARLGISQPPRQWTDLADPRYRHQLALADPQLSGSVTKSFEMLIQQQMSETLAERRQLAARELTQEEAAAAVSEGWSRALRLIMRLGANARYFSDASSKIALDVAAGEAAAGTTIGLYGRFQSETLRQPDGSSRLAYFNALGGTSFGADPVGLLRGAPHPELARAFIEWALSEEGQKIWNWKVGTPGGPQRYALRRLPIRPSLYDPKHREHRSDPDENPYRGGEALIYREAWTGALFRPIALAVRVMCLEPHQELKEAWAALIAAGFPPEATATFSEVSALDYTTAQGPIRTALRGRKIDEMQLAKTLASQFRAQYQRAAELARAGK